MWPSPHLTPPNNMTLEDAILSDGQRERERDALWQLTEHTTIAFNIKAAASQPNRWTQIIWLCIYVKSMHIQFVYKIDMNRLLNSRGWDHLRTLKRLQSKVNDFKNVAMTSSIVDGIQTIHFFIIMIQHSHYRQENNLRMDALCLWGESINVSLRCILLKQGFVMSDYNHHELKTQRCCIAWWNNCW